MTSSPDRYERDLALVRRFQGGEGNAFDALVEDHRREVYRLAYRLLGNHEDADDLAQETFLRAYRALRRFRGDSSFRTWLTRIVLNLAADRRKWVAKRPQIPLEFVPEEDFQEPMPAASVDPIRKEVLHQAVSQLPPRQRETLILRVFQEMKFQEIAAVMGCTVGTAKANFFHALKGLRERVRG
jgi:RNA polymerase sigma-70 factor (ECF subfamily)